MRRDFFEDLESSKAFVIEFGRGASGLYVAPKEPNIVANFQLGGCRSVLICKLGMGGLGIGHFASKIFVYLL
jgi:hypothetical protein